MSTTALGLFAALMVVVIIFIILLTIYCCKKYKPVQQPERDIPGLRNEIYHTTYDNPVCDVGLTNTLSSSHSPQRYLDIEPSSSPVKTIYDEYNYFDVSTIKQESTL